jgi:predicted transcriptional regulator
MSTSTTTIRLSKELTDKIARPAERAGKTPHSFVLEAIADKADLEERRTLSSKRPRSAMQAWWLREKR